MIIPEEGNEVIIQSSLTLSRDQTAGLCGGLEMSMGARITENNQIVMDWVADGTLSPLVQKILPLDDAVQALRWVAERKVVGRVVVTP